MGQDIDGALQGWDYKPGVLQARLVQATDGRQVIQMRIDLGALQIEIGERPDGARPHGCKTYFQYLQQHSHVAARAGQSFALTEEQCLEADREFVQFYNRRICWLALRNYAKAVKDADHTLAFMDFVKEHSPGEEYTQTHEQYRGFVLFQRAQASTALAMERNKPEEAIDEVLAGIEKLHSFFVTYGMEEQFEGNGMVQQLRKMEKSIRQANNIDATLQEQLKEAVAREEYEAAARIRDELRKRQ